MDQGVSRFWKSSPQRTEQVDNCSPTFRTERVGKGRRAGGGGSKGWPMFYFRSYSLLPSVGGLSILPPLPLSWSEGRGRGVGTFQRLIYPFIQTPHRGKFARRFLKPYKIYLFFKESALGRFFHRVAMSGCRFICLSLFM